MKLARLLARLFIGGMFIGHGTQKLFGWFGGPGIDGTTGMMEKLGLAPPRTNAYAASLSEALGGAAIALAEAEGLDAHARSVAMRFNPR